MITPRSSSPLLRSPEQLRGDHRVSVPDRGDRLPPAFTTPGSASFTEFLASYAPDLLPGRRRELTVLDGVAPLSAHATTIVALTYADGVVMAGDRRATMGTTIAHRQIEKVFPADDFSAIGIAGTAGLAIELVRLFQLELEHFEKIEGSQLSLEGKANRLATMVRANLGLAIQGLAAVPLFGGYDERRGIGGSSPTTSSAAGTRSRTTTASGPARCSRAGR